jgi:hypothetical protein
MRDTAAGPRTPPDPVPARVRPGPSVTVDHAAPAANMEPLLALIERLARQERRAAAAKGVRR